MELDYVKSRIIYSYIFCVFISVLSMDCPQNIVDRRIDLYDKLIYR
jgi:hypothetical protein